MVGLIGKKLGQTRVYIEGGQVVSVTIVQAGPNHVLQRKTVQKDGYEAVQLGFDHQKSKRMKLAAIGHLKAYNSQERHQPRTPGKNTLKNISDKDRNARVKSSRKDWDAREVNPVRRLREFREFSLDVKPGDTIGVDIFSPGDFVDVIGITKGRGFQGVMKRHNYGGGRASHGAKGFKRRPGAISSGSTPGYVIKGKPMPGQMGQRRRTVQNLEIIRVHPDDNLLLVKGAIPGAGGDYIVIREAKKKPKKV